MAIYFIKYWREILGVALAALLWLHGYQSGKASVQAKWNAAIAEQKEKSREDIIDTGRAYAKIRDKIVYIKGDNNLAGARTEYAIDSVPTSHRSK